MMGISLKRDESLGNAGRCQRSSTPQRHQALQTRRHRSRSDGLCATYLKMCKRISWGNVAAEALVAFAGVTCHDWLELAQIDVAGSAAEPRALSVFLRSLMLSEDDARSVKTSSSSSTSSSSASSSSASSSSLSWSSECDVLEGDGDGL